MMDDINRCTFKKASNGELLKQLSRSRGVSKAEIIRQAIQRETAGEKQYLPAPDPDVWQEIPRFLEVEKLKFSESPSRWAHQDAYSAYEKRFPPRSSK
jgi:hypothetical protein